MDSIRSVSGARGQARVACVVERDILMVFLPGHTAACVGKRSGPCTEHDSLLNDIARGSFIMSYFASTFVAVLVGSLMAPASYQFWLVPTAVLQKRFAREFLE